MEIKQFHIAIYANEYGKQRELNVHILKAMLHFDLETIFAKCLIRIVIRNLHTEFERNFGSSFW